MKNLFYPLLVAVLGSSLGALAPRAAAAQVQYNGICLPDQWPPNVVAMPDPAATPFYLEDPPTVIPIDVGRQLLVDDFLIASTTLSRCWHEATYYQFNPIIPIDRPWEEGRATDPSMGAVNEVVPAAMTFAGGVWYDPKEQIFKMFYDVLGRYLCLATSKDGIHWVKPALGVVPGTNIVIVYPRRNKGEYEECDNGVVWLDSAETDPSRRFKALVPLMADNGKGLTACGISLRYSADGRRWSDRILTKLGYGDGGTFFYNPFRKVWVLGLRDSANYFGFLPSPQRKIPQIRIKRYHEAPTLTGAFDWGTTPYLDTLLDGRSGVDHTVKWLRADSQDEHFPGLWDKRDILPGVYDVEVNAYESIMLGAWSIIPGWWPDGKTKRNYGSMGFSRDGFTFDRPYRGEFLARGNYGDWNTGYLHPAGGVCLVVGDKLYFYLGARQPVANDPTHKREYHTGLAILRRDGFASMDAGGAEGTLTTRPVRFRGKYLFANFETLEAARIANHDSTAGVLAVEVLDQDGHPIEPFTLADSVPAQGDSTCRRLRWKAGSDLSSLAGKPVRFRFHLRNGKLYSFWVTPSERGASYGYVAAGGPGFDGPTDTVGGPE